MTQPILSQESLRALLHYDPDTGIFTWLVTRGRAVAGSKAGTLTSLGYINIRINYKPYKAHRLAWLYLYEYMPEEIGHDNGNPRDNRISNLVDITHAENMKNIKKRKDNSSGCMGVHFCNTTGKWVARQWDKGKVTFLGNFAAKEAAIRAKKAALSNNFYHANHGTAR